MATGRGHHGLPRDAAATVEERPAREASPRSILQPQLLEDLRPQSKARVPVLQSQMGARAVAQKSAKSTLIGDLRKS